MNQLNSKHNHKSKQYQYNADRLYHVPWYSLRPINNLTFEAKRLQIKLKASSLHWLIKLNLNDKVIPTYGMQLWGPSSNTSIELIQRVQSNVFSKKSQIHSKITQSFKVNFLIWQQIPGFEELTFHPATWRSMITTRFQ